tara:strand:+ start:1121 stop:1372 length:252 start_codon:yes stop_codon:yes gene_type:complete
MKNQIKTEELTKLQNLSTVLRTTQDQIGNTEVQKHMLLHRFDILSQELNKFKSELQESYGKINIDTQDGSYETIKEDESNKKN